MIERSTCSCGGHEVVTRIWDGTYEVRCNRCGSHITYFRSSPEDAEANGYLIWLEVINEHTKD